MAEYLIQDTTLSAIAEAIRNKTGKADNITPEQMPTEIMGITTGGGEGEKPFDCHSVTFVYDDKSYVRSVADGDTCADPVARGLIPTPTKESTAQYNYTFYGWGASDGGAANANILKNITEDKTVYAIFTATVRYYTITWLDSDGVTVLKTETLPYGATPEAYTPGKDGHAFTGWDKEITTVTGDATYTATWVTAIGGACGDSASWMLDAGTGTLTISGTGATNNYGTPTGSTPVPWAEYIDSITSVVVEEGITKLGPSFFDSHTMLTSVTLPNSLTEIGPSAFAYCTSLESITLPDGLVTISSYAFQSCTKLSTVNLPDGLKAIYTNAFRSCSAITDVTIPSSVTSLGSEAFRDAGLKSVTTHITGSESFRGCPLETLTITEGITVIKKGAFWSTKIGSVTIPASVTRIEYRAFQSGDVTSAIFVNTSGWRVTESETSTGGTLVNVTDPVQAGTYLCRTYHSYYWNRK